MEKLDLKRLMAAFVKMRPRLEAAALARVRSAATAEDLVQARNASKKTAFSLFGRAMATHAFRAETARIPSDTRNQRDVAPVSNPILPDEGMRAHCLIAHGITTQVQLFNGSSRRDSPDAGQARISGMGTRVLDQGGSRVSGKKAPGQQAVPKTAVHCPSSWGDAHSRRRPFRSSNQWNRAGTISPDR